MQISDGPLIDILLYTSKALVQKLAPGSADLGLSWFCMVASGRYHIVPQIRPWLVLSTSFQVHPFIVVIAKAPCGSCSPPWFRGSKFFQGGVVSTVPKPQSGGTWTTFHLAPTHRPVRHGWPNQELTFLVA
jgi:hypothetical protein